MSSYSNSLLLTSVIALPSLAALLLYFGAWRRSAFEERALLQLPKAGLANDGSQHLVVILPARNEALGIEATLNALLQDQASELAVYVFDDESDDDTAAIVTRISAGDSRLHLLQPKDVPSMDAPEACFGKPWAQQRALYFVWKARGHRDDNVLFLDADVVLEPDVLGGVLSYFDENKLDALSGNPRMKTHSLVEELFIPAFVSLVASQYAPSKINAADSADKSQVSFLNGQFILVRGAVLDEVQGWSKVLGTVLEDVAFAKMLSKNNKKTGFADLRPIASTQMYSSWSEIRQGFGKNAVALFGGPFRTSFLAFVAATLSLAPWSSVVAAFLTLLFPPGFSSELLHPFALFLGCFLSWGAILFLQAKVRRRMGHAAWPVFFLPAVYVGVAFVLVEASCKKMIGGRILWKGRSYQA
ncbi:MAG: glycosyltransferase [Deltaproteobacteria bacterium]|nr:glycosyltransferase [Deltaproteobacteria bacterium]